MTDPWQLVQDHMEGVVCYAEQYLSVKNWFESRETQQSLDASGPVPWLTYPALKVLDAIVHPHWRVLEYGSGNSSIWWRDRVSELVSVEHDPEWLERLGGPPENHTVKGVTMNAAVDATSAAVLEDGYFARGLAPAPTGPPDRDLRAGLLSREFAAYAAVILDYPPGYFDVVVVDGMARVLTAWLAAHRVNEAGIVVFDNSDREEYADGYEFLRAAGFHRLDFWGTGPVNPYEWCTSIFTQTLSAFP